MIILDTEYSHLGLAYGVEFGQVNEIVIVTSVERQQDRTESVRLAEAIQKWYGTNASNGVTVGIGKTYDDFWKIHEACAATESQLYKNQRSIICFEDIASLPQSFWLSSEEEVYWTHSLKQGDRQLAREVFDSLLRSMCPCR